MWSAGCCLGPSWRRRVQSQYLDRTGTLNVAKLSSLSTFVLWGRSQYHDLHLAKLCQGDEDHDSSLASGTDGYVRAGRYMALQNVFGLCSTHTERAGWRVELCLPRTPFGRTIAFLNLRASHFVVLILECWCHWCQLLLELPRTTRNAPSAGTGVDPQTDVAVSLQYYLSPCNEIQGIIFTKLDATRSVRNIC